MMKELYTTPEVKLISFVSEERIASSGLELLEGSDPVTWVETDITIEFDLELN